MLKPILSLEFKVKLMPTLCRLVTYYPNIRVRECSYFAQIRECSYFEQSICQSES